MVEQYFDARQYIDADIQVLKETAILNSAA